MDVRLDFSAVKYSRDLENGELRLDQFAFPGEFDGHDLGVFNPIQPHEVFEIELREGLDPMLVLPHLKFDNKRPANATEAFESAYPVDWLDDIDCHSKYGEVSRLAVLKQGGETWHIVGLPYERDLVLVLMDPENHDDAETRYFARRVLAEYSCFPKGWQRRHLWGRGALFDAGLWWIVSSGASNGAKDTIFPSPQSFGEAFVSWLTKAGVLPSFALSYARIAWHDEDLQGRLEAAVSDLKDLDELGDIGHALSGSEIAEVTGILDNGGSIAGRIIRILEENEGLEAEALVVALETAAIHRDTRFLTDLETFKKVLQSGRTSGSIA